MTRSLCALALALAACNLNDQGRDPPRDQLFFPADLAVDPSGRFAFVTNANTDLRYNGGTIATVDLQKARDLIDALRAGGDVPPDCRRDVLDPTIVECNEKGFILADRTIKIGNFAGGIVYQAQPDGGGRLFAVVRGDPSVVWSDVKPDEDGTLRPTCGTVGFVPCDRDHRLSRSEGLDQEFPSEPFGLSLDPAYGLLYVAHFGGDGALSLFDVGGDGTRKPRLVDVATGFLRRSNDQASAAFGVAALPLDPRDPAPDPCQPPYAYVTSRVSNDIAIATVRDSHRCGVLVPPMCTRIPGEVGRDPCLLERRSLDLSRVALAGLAEVESVRLDIRDIVFTPDGKNAFVVARQPSALLVYDTAFLEGSSRRPRLLGVRAIEVCAEPTHVSVYQRAGQIRALVTCFSSGQMFVVDPQIGAPVTVFDIGRGPNGVHVAGEATDSPLGVAVSFADQNLVLVDLKPNSSTEYKVVLRIGFTRPISR